jgi:hypothetical protein
MAFHQVPESQKNLFSISKLIKAITL